MKKGTIRCPECDKELFTDGSYLSLAPCKSDPKDDLMKAARHWVNCPGINAFPELDRRIMVFARLVQAGIQNNNQLFAGLHDIVIPALGNKIESAQKEIKAVQKLSGGKHQLDILQALSRKLGNANRRMQGIEGQIKDLDGDIERHEGDVTAAHRRLEPLERKVEELGEKIKCLTVVDLLRKDAAKPQPEEPVAQAPDKDGNPHDLIEGRSVYKNNVFDAKLFTGRDKQGLDWGIPLDTHKWWENTPSCLVSTASIWLFDLDFPGGGK